MFLKNIIEEYSEYKELIKALKAKKTPIAISGVAESAQSSVIYTTASELKKNSLVIAYNDIEAGRMADDLEFYGVNSVFFPSKEYTFYEIDTKNHYREYERINALYKLLNDENVVVVASLEAICGYTVDKDTFARYFKHIKTGDIIDITKLEKELVIMGYVKEDIVEGKGQFSVRGGIFDIYCPNMENPVRIEFFDNEVDSIREFDFTTQLSMENLESADIIVCSELIFDNEKCGEVVADLRKMLGKKGISKEAEQTVKRDIINFEERHYFAAADKYASLIYGRIPNILEYFDDDIPVFVIEPKRISEISNTMNWEHGELILDLTQKGVIADAKSPLRLEYSEVINNISKKFLVTLKSLSHSNDDFKYKQLINFTTKTTISLHGKLDYLFDDMKGWSERKNTVVILASGKSKGENMAKIISDRGFICRYIDDRSEFSKGEIVVVKGSLSKGFEYPEIGMVLISEKDIYTNEQKKVKQSKIDENTKRLKSFNDINVGDYVVHQDFGIGKYAGVVQRENNGVLKDYLKINYYGSDVLYVPIEQLDLLFKYIGGNEDRIKVNKLGGNEWNKAKAKVRSGTKELAFNLVKLYAERQYRKGYAFAEDNFYQREFEDRFIYQETEDQLRSIQEVKNDMEEPRPMDRLLCGDVGYGKTEVAIRAAFKAAVESKQVAYLCPTTILAMQQYNNFQSRMEDFAVNVEMLSRFRTPSQQKQILKKLKTGEIDIIIGTHRILQKDLEFHDLGLLIVDEEQRFGVGAKEKLKELKKDIDVLTMTATPIPRTLHMAMVDIRDMSILSQPPQNRYPVQTYVLEYNIAIITDAIRKELSRGGQVFYLYNRVNGIERVAEKIHSLIPEAKIAIGHGKMNEHQLEDIMYDMVNGNTDVLVCTTIIETGLDIPNANTMIIEDADKMGLAQLYQLRGRVGRSNRSAYAYFTYRKDRILSDVAQKRLSAIKEFTEFGSGFKIAMRDLEIRGAGNILGAQQHGHMDAVGYDMYCKILKESIDEIQGNKVKEDPHVRIELDVNAYISDKYIKNHNQRIDMYKRIAAIENEDDAVDAAAELIDRYGNIPKAAQNIIDIALIKALAKTAGVYFIEQKDSNIYLRMTIPVVTKEMISQMVKKMPSQILYSSSAEPYIKYKVAGKSKMILPNIKFILQIINELKSEKK